MAIICPTVLASNKLDFDNQINRVSFASRVQLDFMDGEFAPAKSIDLNEAWLPDNVQSDLHLMFSKPADYLETIFNLKPHMVIIHAEADVDHRFMAAELNKNGILAGLCVLPETTIGNVKLVLKRFDHLLIFGGNLGHFGGEADLAQLDKIIQAKEINPRLEIGWDGGANDQNAEVMVEKGVDVINVGGFIQKAKNPKQAYQILAKKIK